MITESWEHLFSRLQGPAYMDMEMRLVQPKPLTARQIRRKQQRAEKYAADKLANLPKLPAKLQRGVELLAGGLTPGDVARELGVYSSQVWKWMNHPDFQQNMEFHGMRWSKKVGWRPKLIK
jgi:hypothetical protein